MSYQNYVIAAYAVFFGVLAYDFIATHLRVKRELRAARRRRQRSAAARLESPA